MRALLVGDDALWGEWRERLVAAGWTVARGSVRAAGRWRARPDAVLLTLSEAPALEAVAAAVATWPGAAVWLVVTGPTPGLQRRLIAAGAAGTVARDPGAWALVRLRATAVAARRRAAPRQAGVARGSRRVVRRPVVWRATVAGRAAEGAGDTARSATPTGVSATPAGEGTEAGPRTPATAGSGGQRAAAAPDGGWLPRDRAPAGRPPRERPGSGRAGDAGSGPWWEWPGHQALGFGRVPLGIVATSGVDPLPLVAEWARRRAASPVARPWPEALPGCLWIRDARRPRDGMPDPRLRQLADRCAAVAVVAPWSAAGLRAARALTRYLDLCMGGVPARTGRLALWLVGGRGPAPRPARGLPCLAVSPSGADLGSPQRRRVAGPRC